ncbi:MAG: acetolactate synthase 3 large subunit [Geminicoccus sp.]|nr:acetolactate synthase 3 large subunit [Geminicoccus sp.]
MSDMKTGAETLIAALVEQGVEVIFGYPGGAVLPIYDALFQQNSIRHILVRHEQAAVHAAEGYARSTGKVGCVLVTSGPGATNAVTGLTDALMDSIPVVCLTGQVPTHLIGQDAFQEADTTGITRACTKHNYLVKQVEDVSGVVHEAFLVAATGRPGPVVIDLPKDVLMNKTDVYRKKSDIRRTSYKPRIKGNLGQVEKAVEALAQAKRPIIYAGGGVINAGPEASQLLVEFTRMTGVPITNTLMGLGAYPASDKQFVGMLGMHGTYEANLAMYNCDVMLNIGARFDDRITGKLDEFSPNSTKIHVDIDPSSINKNVVVDIPIVGDAGHVLEDMIRLWRSKALTIDSGELKGWWEQINQWRGVDCLGFTQEKGEAEIRPQHALKRLQELTQHRDDVLISTEVGQHQMWAAQYLAFEKPNRWMTSGGLGTMGYGFPAAIGMQIGNPDTCCIDVAGEASILMNIQELSTAVQYRLPVKIMIINNQWMGMVRQWQELLHGGRYAESYTDSLPDFVKLAESFGAKGIRATKESELDAAIQEMLDSDVMTIFDCCVTKDENCFPMIPSGKPHYDMLLPGASQEKVAAAIQGEGLALV